MNYLLFFQGPLDWSADIVAPVFYLVILVAIITLALSLFNMTKSPGSLKNFLFGLLGLGAIVLIGYFISTGKAPEELVKLTGVSGGTYQWVGASLFTAAILIIAGLAFLLLDLVRGMFKI